MSELCSTAPVDLGITPGYLQGIDSDEIIDPCTPDARR